MKLVRTIIYVFALAALVLAVRLPGYESNATNASDFQVSGSELVKYTGTAESVTLPSGIKKIGEDAFAQNTHLKTVRIGEGVKEIQYGAFRDCGNLVSVSLPDSLETIASAAFSNNSSLKRLTLGTGLKSIGLGAFAGCDNLSAVRLSSENPYFTVSGGVLYSKNMDTLVYYPAGIKADRFVMPSSVRSISGYAFWGNRYLKTITLSSSLSEIPGYAFSNCSQLVEIAIPYSVGSIHVKAFETCENLQTVVIPASVGTIHKTAFDGCRKLIIEADPTSVAYSYYERWKRNNKQDQTAQSLLNSLPDRSLEETVSDNTTEAADQGTQPVPAPEAETGGQVYIVGSHGQITTTGKPSSVNPVGTGSEVILSEGVTSADVLGQTVVVGSHAVVLMDPAQIRVNDGSMLQIQGVGRIEDRSYYQRADMTEFSIPADTVSIGKLAFARSGLKEIVLPAGMEEIGYGAFYHCDGLEAVSIADTVEWIDAYAFDHTPWLENWRKNKEQDDFLIVGSGVLLAYKGSGADVVIPEGVKVIAPAVFMGNQDIQSVSLPASLTVIGEEAFRNCTALNKVSGGTGLKETRDKAFLNTALSEIPLPVVTQ